MGRPLRRARNDVADYTERVNDSNESSDDNIERGLSYLKDDDDDDFLPAPLKSIKHTSSSQNSNHSQEKKNTAKKSGGTLTSCENKPLKATKVGTSTPPRIMRKSLQEKREEVELQLVIAKSLEEAEALKDKKNLSFEDSDDSFKDPDSNDKNTEEKVLEIEESSDEYENEVSPNHIENKIVTIPGKLPKRRCDENTSNKREKKSLKESKMPSGQIIVSREESFQGGPTIRLGLSRKARTRTPLHAYLLEKKGPK